MLPAALQRKQVEGDLVTSQGQSRFGVPHLAPASVVKRAGWQDSEELRVNNWLTPWDGEEPLDAGLIGLPYSGASINPSAAYAAPSRSVSPFATTPPTPRLGHRHPGTASS